MPSRSRSHAPLLAAALLLAACSSPRQDPAAASPAASPSPPLRPAAYDPGHDPLVNPASLFEPAPADPARIDRQATLYRALDGNPASLNPIFFSSAAEAYLATLLYDTLFTFDHRLEWQVFAPMVERLDESPDHLAYTITLRTGLKWQDGHPLTAEDVCWSWRESLDERVPCPSVRSMTGEIADCRVLGERRLELVHREALPTSRWNALFPIVPRHIWIRDKAEHPDLRSGEYYGRLHRAPVGNGAYRLVEWIENDRIVLERWDEYPGPRPHFKRIVFRIIPDRNAQLLSFARGELDEMRLDPRQFATQTLPGSDFARLGAKVVAPAWDLSYIVWNQDGSNPYFADPRVRRAMTLSCDIDRLLRDVAQGLYQPSRGPWHPDSWMFNPRVGRLPFDLAEAGRLLDQAGWRIDPGREGWRHKVIDGQAVRLAPTLDLPPGNPMILDLAAIYQEDLRSIGVELHTRVLEWATLNQRLRQHQFEAAFTGLGTGVDPDTQRNFWMADQYDREGRFGRNYGGYNNPRVDQLFRAAQREFDRDRRRESYQEIQQLIYHDQPCTFIWHRAALWAVNRRVRGITTGPRGLFAFYPGELGWWTAAPTGNPPTTTH